jgi:hypothetical protein
VTSTVQTRSPGCRFGDLWAVRDCTVEVLLGVWPPWSAPTAPGRPVVVIQTNCPGFDPGTRAEVPSSCLSKLSSVKLQAVYRYQPAGRFWALQGVEAAIFLLLAAALVTACITVVVRSRPS